jgi:hypothetical protein
MRFHLKTLTLGFILSLGLCMLNANAANMGQAYREAEKLSNPKKSQSADQAIQLMQAVRKYSLDRLQEAYEQKKTIQINCISKNFATVKGLLRISEEANVNLRESMITGQSDLINHEYVKIIMAQDRIETLRNQIEGCAGDSDDPLTTPQQQKLNSEISDKSVAAFIPTSDEQAVIIYEPIGSERPEAISASQ